MPTQAERDAALQAARDRVAVLHGPEKAAAWAAAAKHMNGCPECQALFSAFLAAVQLHAIIEGRPTVGGN